MDSGKLLRPFLRLPLLGRRRRLPVHNGVRRTLLWGTNQACRGQLPRSTDIGWYNILHLMQRAISRLILLYCYFVCRYQQIFAPFFNMLNVHSLRSLYPSNYFFHDTPVSLTGLFWTFLFSCILCFVGLWKPLTIGTNY